MWPTALLILALASSPSAHPHRRAAKPKRRGPMRMTATAYCDKGHTDAGPKVARGMAAADPRVLPFGSVVRVDGLGGKPQTFVVTDTGSAVKGRRLDIFMPSCRAARRFGKRSVVARLVGTRPVAGQ
jgi:3D (Asp-Asp-Asp) domain-containing protein